MRILIIEDELALGKLLKDKLEAESYAVDVEGDGDRGLYLARTTDYDAIVLDDILPGKHGFEICKELRGSGKTTPILLMSAESPTDKRVKLLNEGVDDYLAKPFAYEEMSARLRALMRRPRGLRHSGMLQIADLVLDETASTAARDGKIIHLTGKEFALLQYLMNNAGRIVTHAMILEHVWDKTADEFSNMVETHIYNLRRKVDGKRRKKLIFTISGRGYLMKKLS